MNIKEQVALRDKTYRRDGGMCCETCKHFSGDENFYAGGECLLKTDEPCVDNGGHCDVYERENPNAR